MKNAHRFALSWENLEREKERERSRKRKREREREREQQIIDKIEIETYLFMK